MPKDLRKLFSNIFVFRVSKQELKTIFDETIEDKDKQEMVSEITKFVFDRPFEYLFINTDSQRLFKGWDELVFSGDDDNNLT